ncbi:MAG: Gfo/Idh/MocA family oxidoreductase [Armatimonadetes bacterium]|nr:Gfo/Idh/MocA family oxidoreductase [Armatimonadota bacterium]
MKPIRTALVGISGMGGSHRRKLHEADEFELVCAMDAYLDRHQEAAEETRQWGVALYDDYWDMLEAHGDVELVVIAAPHHWHAPYSLVALERGLHVFVEKPVTVTVQEATALLEAQQAADRLVGVHFQWTSYGSSQQLKKFLVDGGLGAIEQVIASMKWHRTDEYYLRNEWAGRRYVDGRPVWDGVLMNQAIHTLNSALEFATRKPEFATPERVQAELYRVHDIETEDVACLRAQLDEAVLTVYATTCCDQDYPTTFRIEGEKGYAEWQGKTARVVLNSGEELVFDAEPQGDDTHRNMAACLRGEEAELYAPAREAVKSTVTANACYLSAGRIDRVSWEELGDIAGLIDHAAQERLLFSELRDAPEWARTGEVVEVADMYSFDGLPDDPPEEA